MTSRAACSGCLEFRLTHKIAIKKVHTTSQMVLIYHLCKRCLWIYAWCFHHGEPIAAVREASDHFIEYMQTRAYTVPDVIVVDHGNLVERLGTCNFATYLITARHLRFAQLPRDMLRTMLIPYLECSLQMSYDLHCSIIRLEPIELLDMQSCIVLAAHNTSRKRRQYTRGTIKLCGGSSCEYHGRYITVLEVARPLCRDPEHAWCRRL